VFFAAITYSNTRFYHSLEFNDNLEDLYWVGTHPESYLARLLD